ncbi:MAG: G-D-S-L family lipolytic protein, partial [Bacteroidota bacterium]|nr:G-D-S-L family lipolytic protein [Bacteroidota bacterium]
HLTPPDYDEQKGKSLGYAAVLNRYSDWLLSQKSASKWEVIDIHYPMQKYLRAHREVDAKFNVDGFALASDGIHPGETGHWIMARQVLVYLGYKEAANSPSILESLKQLPDAVKYLKLITERQNLMRDAWLSETKHKRPGLPVGLPLNEAQKKSEELRQQIQTLLKVKNK